MAQPTVPSPGWKPQPQTLQQDNMKAYWERAWEADQTGWKKFEESKPFHDNIVKCLRATHPEALGGEGDEFASVRRFLRGKRVLVPLCGDSYALRYFLDQGVEAVVGVDLALMAIERNAAVNFSTTTSATEEVDATTFTHTKQVLDCGDNLPAAVTFTITSNAATTGGGVATLVAGSLFDVPLATLLGGRVDLVYDRASMVALPPDLRGAYVHTLALLRPSLVVLELVRRRRDPPEALLCGPPFDIPVEEVTRLYAAAAATTAGSEGADDSLFSPLRLVTVDDAAAMAFAAGTPLEGASLDVLPPFRFALYALTA